MSASEALSNKLFHGTGAFLNKGDVIEPRGKFYAKGNTPQKAAFATTDPEEALQYAYTGLVSNQTLFAPVYEVEPINNDVEHFASSPQHHISLDKGFKVKGVHRWATWED